MRLLNVTCGLLLLLLPAFCTGQINPLKTSIIILDNDTVTIDSLSMVPGSFKITGSTPDSASIKVDYLKARLIITDPALLGDTIQCSYQTFPFNFYLEYANKKFSREVDTKGNLNPFIYTPDKTKTDIFQTDGISKSGSISRGVSFGNNQDVVVNSNLNLQLSGKIKDDIEILAAISDDNIPIQAEGNTQQLQEFDKVFIQFSNKHSRLIAGDFQLTRPEGYFMNYFKKAQGGSFNTNTTLKNGAQNALTTSAAVSRGKFALNRIQGSEGNQGPYKLKGAENELFIIVLSGTEKVFIDGQLMMRGLEYDYTIDYNTAEITFTPKQLITKDKRITVEFQYSDKNYSRSLLQFSDVYQDKKVKAWFNFFSEQDNKAKPLLQELSDSEKNLLSDIGDTLLNAVVPSIDTVPYDPNLILYAKTDSLINGFIYPVYYYSTNADSAIYRLNFSFTGSGNGNYIPANTRANGKVYKWVAPVNGVRQGSYEPVVLLITPKKKQMFTSGVEYHFSPGLKVSAEGALSVNDLNTFSSINREDDNGAGLKTALEHKMAVGEVFSAPLILTSSANYEIIDKNFEPIERYRSIEFERDWNLPSAAINEQQQLLNSSFQLSNEKAGFVKYGFSFFDEHSNYKGSRHLADINVKKNKTSLNGDASFLQSDGVAFKSAFLRYKSVLSQEVGKFNIGLKQETEENHRKDALSDSLIASSFEFIQWEVFAASLDSLKNRFGISYQNRLDRLVSNNDFKNSSTGENINGFINLSKDPRNRISLNTTYRRLTIHDSTLTSQKSDNTVVSRLEYNGRIKKGLITLNTFYEFGSGQELKKLYTYLEVPAGQGVYAWNDYNENGIKEVNEFEIAVYRDLAKYIRVFTPTNEYVRVYSNQFSQVLNINPAAVWNNQKNLKKALSYFSDQVAYRVDRKTNNTKARYAYNPLANQTSDSNLVSISSTLRNTLYVNRGSMVLNGDYTILDNRNKSLLVNGFEIRSNFFHEANIRWTFIKDYILSGSYKTGNKELLSEFFSNRDYSIKYYELIPEISYQPNTSFRLTGTYRYSYKINHRGEEPGVRSIIQSAGTEARYSVLSSGSFSAKFNVILINYNGATSSPLAYEMLESLKAGTNYTWNLSYQKNLTSNIQIIVSYEGRKSEDVKSIHTGNVQVRAFF